MARTVRYLSALIVAGFVALVAFPSAIAAEPETVTITLPSGVSLPPGTYDAVVAGPGGQVQAKVVVGTPPVPQQESGGAGGVITAVLVTVGVIGAGVLAYWKILVPRRRRRSYGEAMELFAAGEFRRALPWLTQIEGKLPEKLRAEARFYIAFALFQLDSLDEAEHLLAALHRENAKDVPVAYLLAYLRTTRRDHEGAEAVLDAIAAARLLSTGRMRKLYSIVKFQRALEALRDGQIDAAVQLFQTVEQLGDFADEIPAGLRSRHQVLGTQALFDKDIGEARKHFTSLEEASAQLAPGAREQTAASAKLGLALAAWIEDAPDSPDIVENLLVGSAQLLDPSGALEMDWPATIETSVADNLATLNQDKDADLTAVLRDIHFLRGMAILRSPSGDVAMALRRFACARSCDPDFSDVYLVVGLLKYHLGPASEGVTLLRQAQKLGARDPEVRRIISEHSQPGEDPVDRYLNVLDTYAGDDTVLEQVRSKLVHRLSSFRKVRDWDQRRELARGDTTPPTVTELTERSSLLRERVTQLLATHPDAPDLAAARELTHKLEHDNKALMDYAKSIHRQEAELLALLGHHLLAETES
jgi:tetratricopeptide (TPR) repeat protein